MQLKTLAITTPGQFWAIASDCLNSKVVDFFKGKVQHAAKSKPDRGTRGYNEGVFRYFPKVEVILQSTLEETLLSNSLKNEIVSTLHLCSTLLTYNIYLIYFKLRMHYKLKWRNREPIHPKVKKK